MIHYNTKQRIFNLQTENTSYMIQILPTGHVAHLYYGRKIRNNSNYDNFVDIKEMAYGSSTSYSDKNHGYSLNFEKLEYSTYGKGDYRDPSLSLLSGDGNRTFDFLYDSHEISDGKPELEGLPSSYGTAEEKLQTLQIKLIDKVYNIALFLSYSLFQDRDIITRNVLIENCSDYQLTIDKISSFSIDFDHCDFDLISLDGAWIRERHSHRRALNYGKTELSSRKGVSSPDHNPFMVLCDSDTTENRGDSYGFSLMYSGNHSSSAEVNTHNNTRVQMGINYFDFDWKLDKGETFQSPEAVMGFSENGLNGLSSIYHTFIRHNIVRGTWKYRERPVLINNWEATYFDFTEEALLKLARESNDVGIELFVLDDGWFGKRNSDRNSLGDWTVNKKKLPDGIKGLADKIKKIGMDFGIWVEPEMISIDSDLYRKHPEWMVRTPLRDPSPGRFQYLLDLSSKEVCQYIYQSMHDLFSSADITYVKWDMNRNFSDIYSRSLPGEKQKEFSHRYVLGLYGILERLTAEFPHILFESCASGGSRFDLGMFYYMPQIWTSDNTDSIERLHIQYGSSLLAPPSVMGAHVSAVPNHQILRNTPLESRFNTAVFGLLGYELDISKLSDYEKKVIKEQILFYKQNRKLLQFGEFSRIQNPKDNSICLWMVVSLEKDQSIVGYYQQLAHPNPGTERYKLNNLNEDMKYFVTSRTQYLDISQSGELINTVSPIENKADGSIHDEITAADLFEVEKTSFSAFGDQLMYRGFVPRQQFYGTGLDDHNAFIGDFGSRLFILKN